MPLEAIVALALAAVAAVAAYRNEKLGAALLVGVGVLTVLYLLLGAQDTVEDGTKGPIPSGISVGGSSRTDGDGGTEWIERP
ncbi:hypothetical protein [Streptomyces sp. NBC_01361]|uniref:hypothetical protein n=1 Tax=Streptomyces sp. NBC_01361 TaxID=2903838 RepID=UPI002E2F6A85|nr:hypothetical protein [Streptomyces sp. NBC_01361]